jgi:hypothetical protein
MCAKRAHLGEALAVAAVEHGDAVAHQCRVGDEQSGDGARLVGVTVTEAEGRAGRGDDRDILNILELLEARLGRVAVPGRIVRIVNALVLGLCGPLTVVATGQRDDNAAPVGAAL